MTNDRAASTAPPGRPAMDVRRLAPGADGDGAEPVERVPEAVLEVGPRLPPEVVRGAGGVERGALELARARHGGPGGVVGIGEPARGTKRALGGSVRQARWCN